MKNSIYYFISGIIVVVFGIFVILNPSAVVNIAAFLFSVVLLLKGLRTLFNTLRFDNVASKVSINGIEINIDTKKGVRKTMYLNAFISLLVGLIALIISIVAMVKKSSSIMKIVVYVVASGFLVSGVTGILENRKMKSWTGLDEAIGEKTIFQLIVALVLFIFPSLIGNVFMNILGAIVVAFGALYFAWGVYLIKAKKTLERMEKKEAEDVSWKDVDNTEK
ncbi:MAG: DUF308 domain-containing protein [Spirochaetales bacterium]|nr:DUF308 domain-containing protein [Spirochaetales bacterium]MDD6841166.1 DUF308 domain-containing protein [Spirochaetales bacterium]